MKFKFPVELNKIQIHIETGPCFGFCPIYTLSIAGTGEVIFEGERFVVSEGIQSKKISPEKVKDLIAAAFEIGFFEMASSYSSENHFEILPDGTMDRSELTVTDHPVETFTISIGNRIKTVEAYWGYPKRLAWFHDLILDVTGADKWIQNDSDDEQT